jgi:serine/threonine protein kinase
VLCHKQGFSVLIISRFLLFTELFHVSCVQGCERIVRMYGACLLPPQVAIIYEYVPGGSLHDRIYSDTKPPLSVVEVLTIGRDIAEGLVRASLGLKCKRETINGGTYL